MDNTELHYLTYDDEEIWMAMTAAYIAAGGDILYPGDEKENLMDASEARKRLRDALRERVKGLFTRPTPWEKLNGRERARRLVQTLYRKRSGKIGGQKAGEAYDRARYSPHDVDAAQMDALRKEIRP